MEQILNTDNKFDKFNFTQLKLSKPKSGIGGNYLIKISIIDSPLYIQPPKCITKNGFLKAGKRHYADLLFNSDNDIFIRWMENLENACQQALFNNRADWFDGDMEMHDIENYFTSPLKSYKSGKYYATRVNVLTNLGNSSITIYDESENVVQLEDINEDSNLITILHVSGIKCTATCFQLEFIVKQILLTKPQNLFEKCIIKSNHTFSNSLANNEIDVTPRIEDQYIEQSINEPEIINEELIDTPERVIEHIDTSESMIVHTDAPVDNSEFETDILIDDKLNNVDLIDELSEVTFNLDELPMSDNITLKQQNDVYYEMYRAAKQKSKIARDLALTAYLNEQFIKNTYKLSDIDDDEDDEDDDNDDDNDDNDEKNDKDEQFDKDEKLDIDI